MFYTYESLDDAVAAYRGMLNNGAVAYLEYRDKEGPLHMIGEKF